MKSEEKYLKYKDRVVFGKQSMPYFDRIPKQYAENEACFVFVNKGEVSVRSQIEPIHLDKNQGLLAKCLNYFFETNEEQRKSSDGVEVIAVLLYPSIVQELFEFDISNYDYSFDFNIKLIRDGFHFLKKQGHGFAIFLMRRFEIRRKYAQRFSGKCRRFS